MNVTGWIASKRSILLLNLIQDLYYIDYNDMNEIFQKNVYVVGFVKLVSFWLSLKICTFFTNLWKR